MKRKILVLAYCFIAAYNFTFAQVNTTSYDILGKKFSTNNYSKITEQLDAYWDSNPNKDDKGSGYKLYNRWKEYWKYYLNEDGSLMNADQINNQYMVTRQLYRNALSKSLHDSDFSNWMPLGPFTHQNKGSWSAGQGRVNVSTINPQNQNTLFVGSPNGGLWKSMNNGQSWEILTENTPIAGVSGIAVDYNDTNTIYVSTGDEDASDSPSSGIFKTTDGGKTWKQITTAPISGSKTGEILMHPNNSNILWYVATNGFFKTIDAGVNWTREYNTECKELRLKPGNPDVIYAVSVSGTNVNIIRSTDGGNNFSIIQSYTSAGRTVIDVTPADSNYLYVLVSDNDNTYKGIYRSTDGGETFTTQNTTTNVYESSKQAYYDLALTVSTTNKDLIFTGCLNVWKSTNGGVTITKLNNWNQPNAANYTHADIHDLKYYNDVLYAGTDGGIYISNNNGTSFSDKTKNGLNISQFYRLDVAQTDSVQLVGGLQDNGGFSYANRNWVNFYGADGMDAAIDPTSPTNQYGFIQNGGTLYTIDVSKTNATGGSASGRPSGESGNWITPLEFGNQGTLYAGYKKLYTYSSGAFNVASSYNFTSNITQIRVHPENDLKVLVSSPAGLFRSDGTGDFNITKINNLPSNLKNFDYNRNTPTTMYAMTDGIVYKSINDGETWQNITYNLPTGAKNGIIHQASSYNNTVYLAMNKAVYYTDDSLKEWKLYSNNIPNSTITDIEINNVENHIVISTYGRGIWRSPVAPSSLKSINVKSATVAAQQNKINIYPNPTNEKIYMDVRIEEPNSVHIFNVEGKKVLELKYNRFDKETAIDCTTLKTGTYVINLISENHLITQKFVKY